MRHGPASCRETYLLLCHTLWGQPREPPKVRSLPLGQLVTRESQRRRPWNEVPGTFLVQNGASPSELRTRPSEGHVLACREWGRGPAWDPYPAQAQDMVSRERPFCELGTGETRTHSKIQKREELMTKGGASVPRSCKSSSSQVAP